MLSFIQKYLYIWIYGLKLCLVLISNQFTIIEICVTFKIALVIPENIIEISKSFNIDAQIIGRVEKGNQKQLLLKAKRELSYITKYYDFLK